MTLLMEDFERLKILSHASVVFVSTVYVFTEMVDLKLMRKFELSVNHVYLQINANDGTSTIFLNRF